jgi:hypothetical protein
MKISSWYFVGAALAGVALFLFIRDRRSDLQVTPVGSPSAGALQSQADVSLTPWHLEDGTELVYRLDYRGEIEPSSSEASSPNAQVLDGALHVGVIAKTLKGYDVRMWLLPNRATGPDGDATQRAMNRILKDAVTGHLDFYGFQLRLTSEASLSEDVRSFWQSLLERLAAPVPPELFGTTRTAHEKIGGVAVESTYEWQCGEDCGQTLSHETRLLRTIRPLSPSAERTVEGSVLIAFKPDLKGVATIEASTVESIGPAASKLRVKSRVQLTFVAENHPTSPDWAIVGSSHTSTNESHNDEVDGTNQPIDQAVVAHLDEGEILTELRQNQDLTDLPQATYLRLKSWIAVHPESLPKFTQAVASPTASETVIRAYIKALGAVGHSAAQEAMVEIMGQRARDGDRDTVDNILTAFTMVTKPSEGAEKAIRQLAMSDDPTAERDKAKLALGAVGYHLRQSPEGRDQERAITLEKDLGELLTKAQDRAAREAALGALGNLGPVDLGVLSPYLTSDDPSLRARAYFAVRFSPAEGASQLLVNGLGTETSPLVRRDVLEALAMRPKDQRWLEAVEKGPLSQLSGDEKLLLGRSISSADDLEAKSRAAVLKALEAGTKDPEVRQALSGYVHDLRY